MKNPTSKLTRMRLDLEEYQFTIEFIQGKTNVVADALSRINIDDLKKLNEDAQILKVQTRSMTNNSNIIPENKNVAIKETRI